MLCYHGIQLNVEKQIRSRPSFSMNQDNLGYTPDAAQESGFASSLLTGVSMVLIVMSFPFSMFFCMRMIQVDGKRITSECHCASCPVFEETPLSLVFFF